jgi:hypothetical protein
MDNDETVTIEPTLLELTAVGILIRTYIETFGTSSLPRDMVDKLESFSAKVIQALEPTVYNKGE